MKSSILAFAAVFAAGGVYGQAPTNTKMGVQQPTQPPSLDPAGTVHGCYASIGELVKNSTNDFNSMSLCVGFCRAIRKVVAATGAAKDCYCGDKYPPKSSLVEDSKCDYPCSGFGFHACGGFDTFTVYNTGLKIDVPSVGDEGSTSTASGTEPTVTSTIVVTPSTAPKSGGGSNAAGIAAGVVVGIIAVAAIGGGFFFYKRRQRNKEKEEDERRNASIGAFVGRGHPPSSSGGSDARLDPVMAQRRMSSGSIEDNQDYSRKILRVTNA